MTLNDLTPDPTTLHYLASLIPSCVPPTPSSSLPLLTGAGGHCKKIENREEEERVKTFQFRWFLLPFLCCSLTKLTPVQITHTRARTHAQYDLQSVCEPPCLLAWLPGRVLAE